MVLLYFLLPIFNPELDFLFWLLPLAAWFLLSVSFPCFLLLLLLPLSGFLRHSPLRMAPTWGRRGAELELSRRMIYRIFGPLYHESCIMNCHEFHVQSLPGWWFGTFIFPYIGNNHPKWITHIFKRGRGQPPNSYNLLYIFTNILIDLRKGGEERRSWHKIQRASPDKWGKIMLFFQLPSGNDHL